MLFFLSPAFPAASLQLLESTEQEEVPAPGVADGLSLERNVAAANSLPTIIFISARSLSLLLHRACLLPS